MTMTPVELVAVVFLIWLTVLGGTLATVGTIAAIALLYEVATDNYI